MKQSRATVPVRGTSAFLAIAAFALVLAVTSPAAFAQAEEADPPETAAGSQDDTTSEETTRKERRKAARQARIDRYLEKRDERRARRDELKAKKAEEREARLAAAAAAEVGAAERDALAAERSEVERQALEAERQRAAEAERAKVRAEMERRKAQLEAQADAATPEPAESAATSKRDARAEAAPAEPKKRRGLFGRRGDGKGADAPTATGPGTVRMSRELARAQERLRAGVVGLDPAGREWLDRVDANPTSETVGGLGNYLARRGFTADAVEYYRAGVRAAPDDIGLWLNLGAVHLQRNEVTEAAGAFSQVLRRDPNHAVAHYNLGAALHRSGDYEGAVEEYRQALILDPSLGDPEVNPQVVNNELMVPVRLLLYQQQAGSLGLSLEPVGDEN